MILNNAKNFLLPIYIPNSMRNKISATTNCDLTKDEIVMFNTAIKALSEYIDSKHIDLTDCYILNVFFTYDGSISLSEEDDSVCGFQCQFALYRMKKVRSFNDNQMTLFIFLEELCHYFFRIYDEKIVKYKVEEIYKSIYPSFNLDEFRRRYDLNGF